MNIHWYLKFLTNGPKRTNNGCIHRWPTITLITITQLVLIVFECFTHVSSLAVNRSQISGHKDRSIRSNPVFDNKHNNSYVLSSNQLIELPFGSCNAHKTCSLCLLSVNPLDCGWCGSYCATDDECQTPSLMSHTGCPPEIHDFWPKYGPISGGTVVTIIGDNLGENRGSFQNSYISVKVANSPCHVIEWSTEMIRCTTNPVIRQLSGKIWVQVRNRQGQDDIVPSYDIDGVVVSNQFFVYKPNPRIYSFEPNSTIKSGNTNITVTGINLNSVANPRIQVIGFSDIHNHNRFKSEGKCWVDPSGTQMTCQTPDLNSTKPSPEIVVSKKTNLTFIMDGVKNTGLPERMSRLTYYPDPIFYHFEDDLEVVWYRQPILNIYGYNLRIDYPIDIWISNKHNPIPCYIFKTNYTDIISCVINDTNSKILDVDGRKHRVFISVGNILSSPGEVQFEYFLGVSRNLLAIKILAIVGLVLGVPVVLFLCIMFIRFIKD